MSWILEMVCFGHTSMVVLTHLMLAVHCTASFGLWNSALTNEASDMQEGYSPRNSPPFAVTKQSISILQNHYPERLGYAIVAKPPCIFKLAWNALYPFLDTATRQKIMFVNCGSDVVKSLHGVLGVECIDVSMGGSRPGVFDLKRYAERMMKLQSMHM